MLLCRPGALPVAAVGALVALQFFGGHPETSFHAMVAVVLFFCLRDAGRRPVGADGWTCCAPRGPLAGVRAGSAAAVTLLPLLELLVHSGDYARRLDEESSHSTPPTWARCSCTTTGAGPRRPPSSPIISNRGYYAGGITLMLAAARR